MKQSTALKLKELGLVKIFPSNGKQKAVWLKVIEVKNPEDIKAPILIVNDHYAGPAKPVSKATLMDMVVADKTVCKLGQNQRIVFIDEYDGTICAMNSFFDTDGFFSASDLSSVFAKHYADTNTGCQLKVGFKFFTVVECEIE